MTRFGRKLNHVINTFVKRTPEAQLQLIKTFKKICYHINDIAFLHYLLRIMHVDIHICIEQNIYKLTHVILFYKPVITQYRSKLKSDVLGRNLTITGIRLEVNYTNQIKRWQSRL